MNHPNPLAQLHVVFPDGTEQTIQVAQSPFNIGRVPDNHLPLPDGKVSKNHARLLFEGDRISLVDLNSTHRARVGTTALAPNEPFRLSFGQEFTIGPYKLRLEAAPEKAGGLGGPQPDPDQTGDEPDALLPVSTVEGRLWENYGEAD